MPSFLTNDERQAIRTFMGFPRLVGANPEFDSILDALNGTIAQDGGSCINQVRAILTQLTNLDTNLKQFSNIPLAMVKDINYCNQEIQWRYITGPALVQELSIIFSFPIPGNYFAPAPVTGYRNPRYRRLRNMA
jgi:hypothetical protein